MRQGEQCSLHERTMLGLTILVKDFLKAFDRDAVNDESAISARTMLEIAVRPLEGDNDDDD
jgi:hypothetical protein